MKKKYTILIVLLISISRLAFAQDYMNDIAIKACECLNKVSDTLETERFNIELGLCMINAAEPYKKQLKKDYNIDFNKIDMQGEELGRVIGLKMVSVCPEALLLMIDKTTNEDEKTISEETFEGQVIKIDGDIFVEFSLKDESGKISKFYWLTFIESTIELSNNYKNLIDKSIRITFIPQELFDARIGEYRNFNMIQKLEIVN